MHQKPLDGRAPPGPRELKRSPRPLAAVKGLGPPGGGGAKGRGRKGGEGRREGREGKKGREGKGRSEGEGREKGGPQFKKNDPPPVIRWLVTGLFQQLCIEFLHSFTVFVTQSRRQNVNVNA